MQMKIEKLTYVHINIADALSETLKHYRAGDDENMKTQLRYARNRILYVKNETVRRRAATLYRAVNKAVGSLWSEYNISLMRGI